MSVRSTRLSLSRRPILGALALLAITAAPSTATAQTMSAEWAFAPRGVFGDDRVVQSMRLQIDTDAAAAAGGVSLAYLGNADLAPQEDALILLMAAGILGHEESQVTGITATRACRVWSGGVEGAEADAFAATAEVLASELARVWGELGVTFAPCEVTTDTTQADLLVFPAGTPPDGVDFMTFESGSSFLRFTPPPGAAPGGTGSDVVTPIPAQGGMLGPGQGSNGAIGWFAVIGTTMLILGARMTTRPTERASARRERSERDDNRTGDDV